MVSNMNFVSGGKKPTGRPGARAPSGRKNRINRHPDILTSELVTLRESILAL